MRFTSFSHSRSGFTLVEVVVGMTVFSIGLTAIFALLSSTMTSASYARHETVVAGLLREQMELVKNLRDTNLKNYIAWDKILAEGSANSSWTTGVYIIGNDFTSDQLVFDSAGNGSIARSPVLLKNITTEFSTVSTDENRFERSKLTLDAQGRYTHDQTGTPIPYASYIIVSPLGYTGATGNFTPVQKTEIAGGIILNKNQGYIIDARVIVKNGNNYREYDAKTAITDWVK